MTNKEEIEKSLRAEEPDYDELARKLGQEALPYLKDIAKSNDTLLASKAVYLSGVISNNNIFTDIIKDASGDARPEIRIAAAASLRPFLNKLTDLGNINATAITESIDLLQNDVDVGVQKIINKTINDLQDKPSSSVSNTLIDEINKRYKK